MKIMSIINKIKLNRVKRRAIKSRSNVDMLEYLKLIDIDITELQHVRRVFLCMNITISIMEVERLLRLDLRKTSAFDYNNTNATRIRLSLTRWLVTNDNYIVNEPDVIYKYLEDVLRIEKLCIVGKASPGVDKLYNNVRLIEPYTTDGVWLLNYIFEHYISI